MNQAYQELLYIMKDVHAIEGSLSILHWDQETQMPVKGTENRAKQLSVISALHHQKFTDPKIGELLAKAENSELSELEHVNVREWKRAYQKEVKLPEEFVRKFSETTSKAHVAWVEARKNSDFARFSPALSQIVELCREKAEILGYQDDKYNALLDLYEPDMTTKELDPIVDTVRNATVPILAKIFASSTKIDNSFLVKHYPETQQAKLSTKLMKTLGMDMEACRLDKAVHPFCSGAGCSQDVRITTRYNENYLTENIYSVIHEVGHALYEQGFNPEHNSTPLAESISLGIHESQSRHWENLIGRSRPFAKFLLPILQKEFPEQLDNVSAEDFYKAINIVRRSPIRVEADEVTYNLHVILRYELERGIIGGEIKVKDLPGEWNERVKQYIGYTPKNDAEGVLQDIHWSHGSFGYFATYMLGNLYASQFWATMEKTVGDVNNKVSNGELASILDWLRNNIHQHGMRYSASELVKHVTDEKLNPEYFLTYIKNKYGDIYNVEL